MLTIGFSIVFANGPLTSALLSLYSKDFVTIEYVTTDHILPYSSFCFYIDILILSSMPCCCNFAGQHH